MAALNILKRYFINNIVERHGRLSCRLISTSGKKKESNESCPAPEVLYKKPQDFSKPLENKNWVSYGYSKKNKDEDRLVFHLSMFSVITVALGGYLFLVLYYPDKKRHDWAYREAFIRLYAREQMGLDPVDPNYVDPTMINLPPDEEIDEESIII